ncbi:MAG: PEP-CTERM sorting domain-containing protein [Candidatus Omnitrophota bacterium]
MNKILAFIIFGVILSTSHAHALYVVDGSIGDWGIELNTNAALIKEYLNTHVPSGENADKVTEDNADKNSYYAYVEPGYSGIGNQYDAEAMYFDNDHSYAYFAIVSGLSSQETVFPSGDIFLSTIANPFTSLSYEYAIDVFTGNLYTVGGKEDVYYSQHSIANAWRLTRNDDGTVASENTLLGHIDLVYSPLVNTHSVIEGRVPLAWINADDDVWMHWTMKCGNDYLNLQGSVNTPEPATGALLISGLFGLVGYGVRKRK